jgi:hypothetical protein
MPRTTTSCPRCRQPIVAEIDQLFDMNVDPQAKQKLLSGQANFAHCPNCGYEGPLSTPIVYHDPEKELLLTYFPPELGLPVNEQERLIGPMITQVMNKLPPEKRKAYLLRPQSMFTFETLIERILEGDGITREMIQGQQQRLNLLQRLLSTSPESRLEVIKQEEKLIDQDFFSILSRVTESALAQGDQRTGRVLAGLQQELLANTETGKQLQAEAKEAEEAVKSLQEASKKGLTREILLDLMISAPSETRLNTLVSLTRSGMDYNFFQLLSERINKESGDAKQHLSELRDKLLVLTQKIDEAINLQMKQTLQVIEEIIKSANIEETLKQNLEIVDDFFMQALQSEIQKARQEGNLERSAKLNNVAAIIEKLSAPPPEVELAQKLFDAETEADAVKFMTENDSKITPEFIQMLSGLAMQSEQQGQSAEVVDRFKMIYRTAMRYSMTKNLKG